MIALLIKWCACTLNYKFAGDMSTLITDVNNRHYESKMRKYLYSVRL